MLCPRSEENGIGRGGTVDADLATVKARLADRRYLLVVVAPFHRDDLGQIWLDPLWHRDLVAHLGYLSHLTVLSPCAPLPPGGARDLVRVDPASTPGLRFRELPSASSTFRAALLLPRMAAAAFGAVRKADIVHSGIAGWPIPPGLVVNPLAVLLRRPLVIVVESAFWRLSGVGPHGLAARLRASLTEAFGRWSVRRAQLSVFTQSGYLQDLARGAGGKCILTPATLLDEDDVLSEEEVRKAWAAKEGPPRFVLAARLTPGKGIGVLLEAMRLAESQAIPIEMALIGSGELREPALDLAGRLRTVRLRVLDPVPYGTPFLSLLRSFHAALVPSLTDEQPRIVFDAFSQGLPVLASDTAGHRGLVVPGTTGSLFPAGSAEALLAALRRATDDPASLLRMGLAARLVAAGHTRGGMHLERARQLAALFGSTTTAVPAEGDGSGPGSPVLRHGQTIP